MKTCKKPGCDRPVFGGGYCKYHQYLRKDIKKGIKAKKRPSSFKYKSQLELFNEIWEEAQPYPKCWLTGQAIRATKQSIYWLSHFAHILPKGQYPEFRLKKDNVVLLLPGVHGVYDHPTLRTVHAIEKEFQCSFDKLFQYADGLREEYISLTGKQRHQRVFVNEYREVQFK